MNVRLVDWFYAQNGKRIGPVPAAQFDDLVRAGHITPETLVWREGLANWQPFGLITGTPSSTPSRPASPLPPGGPPPVESGARIGCAECGVAFPESEMIPFAGSWICAKCKPLFLQRVREGAPLAAGGEDAWQSGDTVVTLIGRTLPVRCVKCNGTATGSPITRTFYWHPHWVLVLLLIPLLYVIVFFMVRKPAVVSLPICEEHRHQRRMFIGVSWFLFAIGTTLIIVAISIASEVLVILATAIQLAALCLLYWKARLVSTRLDPPYVWMRGFCKEYRASLPEFPHLR